MERIALQYVDTYGYTDPCSMQAHFKGAMKVVGNARVSTEEQSSNGHSLKAQKAKIEAYAKLYDLGAGRHSRGCRRLRQDPRKGRACRNRPRSLSLECA